MTACAAVLALSDDLKPQLLEMGICEVLIPLTASPSVEVQGNSAAALGNLSSKSDDYGPFNAVWEHPAGGLHGYLVRFLESQDSTFQHIAVWTIVQLLESGDATLEQNIRSSSQVLPLIRQLAEHGGAANGGQDGDRSEGSAGMEGSEDGQDAEGEISSLAKRISELLEA